MEQSANQEDYSFDFMDFVKEASTLHKLNLVRRRLVEKAEELSILLEGNLRPGVAATLKGSEKAKAQHLFLTQTRKIEAELNKLMALTRNFRNEIY